jgi:ElaA protein
MRSVPAGRVSVVETLTPLVVEQAERAKKRTHADRFTHMLAFVRVSKYSTSRRQLKEGIVPCRFPSMSPNLAWQCTPFDDLIAGDLYSAMQLRQRVFVVEQNCPYLDADGADAAALHLLGWENDGGARNLIAYARLLPLGVKYTEASIGRVCTHPHARGTGAGKDLMREAIQIVERSGWGPEIRIAAQMYLERFYEGFGFRRVTEPYLEDDIWHVDMLRG